MKFGPGPVGLNSGIRGTFRNSGSSDWTAPHSGTGSTFSHPFLLSVFQSVHWGRHSLPKTVFPLHVPGSAELRVRTFKGLFMRPRWNLVSEAAILWLALTGVSGSEKE